MSGVAAATREDRRTSGHVERPRAGAIERQTTTEAEDSLGGCVMKRFVLAALLACAVAVTAASVHFVKGPVLSDIGTQLVLSGKLAGLGVGDVTILLNAAGVASVECTNNGGNIAPGQDTAVTASGSITLPADKNGNLVFSVATNVPVIPSSACPNNLWSAEALDVAFGSGTIVVMQGGVVVLSVAF
jgi:hypothetical protein